MEHGGTHRVSVHAKNRQMTKFTTEISKPGDRIECATQGGSVVQGEQIKMNSTSG